MKYVNNGEEGHRRSGYTGNGSGTAKGVDAYMPKASGSMKISSKSGMTARPGKGGISGGNKTQ